jgi:hypothetical protein
VREFFGLRLP